MGLTFLAVRDHQQLVQEFATPWTCWNRTGRFNSQSTQPCHHTVLFFLHHAMGRTRVTSWFYGILLLWQHHRDCQQCACDDEHFESVSGYNFVFPRQSVKFCRYEDSNPCHHIRCRNIRKDSFLREDSHEFSVIKHPLWVWQRLSLQPKCSSTSILPCCRPPSHGGYFSSKGFPCDAEVWFAAIKLQITDVVRPMRKCMFFLRLVHYDMLLDHKPLIYIRSKQPDIKARIFLSKLHCLELVKRRGHTCLYLSIYMIHSPKISIRQQRMTTHTISVISLLQDSQQTERTRLLVCETIGRSRNPLSEMTD